MDVLQLPPAVEISRLRRLKDAVCGGMQRCSSIVAAEDWIADLDARLCELERVIGPPAADCPSAAGERSASHAASLREEMWRKTSFRGRVF
jgi:hypothetical protein